MSTVLDVSRDGSALVLAFNRPKVRNALSRELMLDLRARLEEVETDETVRAVIITGGPEFFSAGADLTEAVKVRTPGDVMAFMNVFHRLAETIERSPKPVIAAIEGFCMTGGCELALACDLRVAGKGSSFAITSSRIGTVAGFGGTQRLPRIVGRANALEILLCAEPIDAEMAFRMGLINRLTEKGGSLAEAKSIVRVFDERAPMSLALAKQAVIRGSDMDLRSAIEFERYLVSTVYTTDDKQEGISAFLEKRKPTFKGR